MASRFCLCKSRPPNGAGLPLTELTELQLTELQRRCVDAGIDAERVDDAIDEEDPKAALAALLAASLATAEADSAAAAELSHLKLSQLRGRALAAGVAEPALEAALNDDVSPKGALVALLLDIAAAEEHDTLEELATLKLAELHRRALAEGAAEAAADDALDSDDSRAALSQLIVSGRTAGSQGSNAAGTPRVVAASSSPHPGPAASDIQRRDLNALSLMSLSKRATEHGLDESDVEAAMESRLPKAALVDLLLASADSIGKQLEPELEPEPVADELPDDP